MPLLFRFAGDEELQGLYLNMGMDAHTQLIESARASAGQYPLIRRLSEYYRDSSFDVDELPALIEELAAIQQCVEHQDIANFKVLCEEANASRVGVEVDCD